MTTITVNGKKCWPIPRYFHCASRAELIAKISSYIIHAMRKMECTIGKINFRVEDVPSADDWAKMDSVDRCGAWRSATGSYGIREVGTLFDSDACMLVANYMGGSNLMASPMFDRESSDEELTKIVENLVIDQLAFDDIHEGDFLLSLTHFIPKE